MSMEKISEAILKKVNIEAQNIIKDAEEKGYEFFNQATKEQKVRFEKEKAKLISLAQEEAAYILAQSSMQARQELSNAKVEVVKDIIDKVKGKLSSMSTNSSSLLNLINETLIELGIVKVVLYIAPKDITKVKKLVREDRKLTDRIQQIKEYDFLGGIIAEDIMGKNRINNSYEARLEKLLPQILPEMNRELFK